MGLPKEASSDAEIPAVPAKALLTDELFTMPDELSSPFPPVSSVASNVHIPYVSYTPRLRLSYVQKNMPQLEPEDVLVEARVAKEDDDIEV